MPSQSPNPERDPMAGEVDRLLRKLNPEVAPARPRPTRPAPSATAAGIRKPPRFSLPTPLGVWGRAALGVVLAAAMTQWPYPTCGLPLLGYFTGAALVLVAGIWAARAAWRTRMGYPHILAILLILTGSALLALQVLPRFGYAPVETAWRCLG